MPATKKQPKKPVTKSIKDQVVDAALSLSVTLGWAHVTVSDIAQETGLSLAEIAEYFEDKGDILIALGRRIDKKTLEQIGQNSPEEPVRDRLFEILMTRFDVLTEDRDALLSILSSLKTDPAQAVISLPHLGKSMAWMCAAAGVQTSGVKGAVQIASLTAVYLATLRIWMEDDSSDLSKTMAALDRNLNRADQVMSLVCPL